HSRERGSKPPLLQPQRRVRWKSTGEGPDGLPILTTGMKNRFAQQAVFAPFRNGSALVFKTAEQFPLQNGKRVCKIWFDGKVSFTCQREDCPHGILPACFDQVC